MKNIYKKVLTIIKYRVKISTVARKKQLCFIIHKKNENKKLTKRLSFFALFSI